MQNFIENATNEPLEMFREFQLETIKLPIELPIKTLLKCLFSNFNTSSPLPATFKQNFIEIAEKISPNEFRKSRLEMIRLPLRLLKNTLRKWPRECLMFMQNLIEIAIKSSLNKFQEFRELHSETTNLELMIELPINLLIKLQLDLSQKLAAQTFIKCLLSYCNVLPPLQTIFRMPKKSTIELPIETLLRLPTNIHKNTLRESLSKCLIIMQNFVDLTIDLPTILPKNRPIELRQKLPLKYLVYSVWIEIGTWMPLQTFMQSFIQLAMVESS